MRKENRNFKRRPVRACLRAVHLGLLAYILLPGSLAMAENSVESFYKGRVLSILIGFPPGGSYDNYARLTAAHMSKYIPGHPTIIVENKPTGGIGVLRSFMETSPKDGSLIGIFPEGIGIIQLTRPDIGKWDVRKLTYLGSFANVNAAFMLRKGAAAQTIEDLKKIPTNVGCNNPLGVAYINPAIMKRLAGFKFNIICGYPGTASFPVALQRGEIDLVSGTWSTWRNEPGTRNGEFRPILQSGLARSKDLPNIPLMQEIVSDPDAKKVIEFLSAGSAIGRALVAPPEVPQERISALRTAFDQLVKDPEFVADAKKMGEDIDPTSGEATQRISNAILDTPSSIVQNAIAASK